MALGITKPRDKLIRKVIDPDNCDRIAQWIQWNALATAYPGKFKVTRKGIDFFLLQRYQNRMWVIAKVCEEVKPCRPPKLYVVSDGSLP